MTTATDEMMEEIRTLARDRQHRLGADMTGSRPLTDAAAAQVLRVLRSAPARNGGAVTAPAAGQQDKRAGQRRPMIQDIEAGFYATPSATGSNDLDFWKVLVNSNSGFKTVKRVLGGGTDRSPRLEPVGQRQQALALGAILRTGLEASQKLFSDNMSRCQDCGHTLTDEESRAAGRGPICRNK